MRLNEVNQHYLNIDVFKNFDLKK